MREKAYLFALNGGELSKLAQARVDLSRTKISAEVMKNFFPRVIGPASARAGTEWLGSSDGDGKARLLPFIFSATDTALVELSDQKLRVWVDQELISRPSVSTVVTNGDFNSSTGWTLTTTGTGAANINSSFSGALALRTPGRGDTAKALRSDSVSVGDQNVEHAINVTVDRGPVKFRVGSTSGGDEYIQEIELRTGFHSLSFTPTSGTYYVQFSTESESWRVVSDVSIAPAGIMEIATPWLEDDLFTLRYDQSADVIYITSSKGTYQPRRIVRYGATSWSLTQYDFTDGPFRGKTADVTLTPSGSRTGNGTLTASGAFFKADHVGTVFRLTHQKTSVSSVLTGEDRYTDSIRVSGNAKYDNDSDGTDENTTERDVSITISGSWSGTVSLEVSYDEGVTWQQTESWTSNQTITRTPGYANSVAYTRIGFQSGKYTSGAATCTLSYTGGGGDGYVLITAVNSATQAEYEVIRRLHDLEGTNEWSEGQFSELRNWPSAVGLFEGRLWWGSADKVFGSITDAFNSYDLEEDGDSGPIIRSIATGAVNSVRWILGLSRLCIGTSGAEPVGRSSSFDEPVTPTNFSIKDASTQGSDDIQAIKVDKSAIYVQRSGKRAYELSYAVDSQDYASVEITRYHPTVLEAGVKVMAVQRQPDTRVWFVLEDGTCAIMTYERGEDVLSWYTFETDGLVEDVAVLPNVDDDDVYMIVNRTIDGVTKRYLERLSYDHQAQGGTDNYMADCWTSTTLSASSTVTGLSHLEGKEVVVWAAGEAVMDGSVPDTFTITSGQISLPEAVTGKVIVGIPYTWQWKSAKLAYGVSDGAPISRRKMLRDIAPVLYKTHIRGIKAGQDFTTMDYLPLSYRGQSMTGNEVFDTYDVQSQCIPGGWDTDARLCLSGQSPLPCTVLAISLTMEGH